MSIECLAWAKGQRTGDPSAKLVLFVLADYANHQRKAWPSLATIAEQSELNRRTVIRKLDLLIEKGLIRKEQRPSEHGDWESNVYTLVTDSHQTGAGGHHPSDPVPPKPSTEPSFNSPPQRGRAHELPDDWVPSPETLALVQQKYPKLELDHELAQFTNHHRSKGSKYVDWDAAFLGWCKRSAGWLSEQRPVGSAARLTRAQRVSEENRQRLARFDAKYGQVSRVNPLLDDDR